MRFIDMYLKPVFLLLSAKRISIDSSKGRGMQGGHFPLAHLSQNARCILPKVNRVRRVKNGIRSGNCRKHFMNGKSYL